MTCPQGIPDCPGFGPRHSAHIHAHLDRRYCFVTNCNVPDHGKRCNHGQVQLIPHIGARCSSCGATARFPEANA